MELKDRVALVTGGGRGIGQGIALALARAGAHVAVADINREVSDETVLQVKALGRRALGVVIDVTDPKQASRMVAATVAELGGLDIAVNNAGVLGLGSIGELTAEAWDRVFAVNVRGMFFCCQAEIEAMRKHGGGGRVINVASIAGKVGFAGMSHYVASKFAVVGFTNALAKEVAKERITVNALCPGIVGTGMWRGKDGVAERWRQAGESEEQSWARHQETLLPQGEAQTPEDMGAAAVYLASASHVTGQALAVDGGFTL